MVRLVNLEEFVLVPTSIRMMFLRQLHTHQYLVGISISLYSVITLLTKYVVEVDPTDPWEKTYLVESSFHLLLGRVPR